MRYGSVCSGIEAATVAWHPLGWEPAWFCEINPFASALLRHYYPRVPNLGDMTQVYGKEEFTSETIDLLVGGTPCQSFSLAGLRQGLQDPRGNLALEFVRLAWIAKPRWILWENVPGVLSANGGRDFGSLLGALAKLGYGLAWRVLDAQYFGVPQRRRRVFLIGYLGNPTIAGAVLFEPKGLQRHSSETKQTAGKESPRVIAPCLDTGVGSKWGNNQWMNQWAEPIAKCLTTGIGQRFDMETESFVGVESPEGPMLRRVTPLECERLQGFPDGYTLIPYRGKSAADAPRYFALGNSMAVPVMAWIGRRIAEIDEAIKAENSD